MIARALQGVLRRVLGRGPAGREGVADAGELVPMTDLTGIAAWDDAPDGAPDVVLFGDSVLERVARQDSDRRSLAEMIAAGLGRGRRCETLSYSAYHSEVYAALVSAIARMASRPACIVIPVNLRSFSPQWDCHPEFRFRREIDLAKRFAAGGLEEVPMVRRSADLKHPPAGAEDMRRYRDTAVDYPGTTFRKIGDFLRVIDDPARDPATLRKRKEALFLFHYANSVTDEAGKLGFLAEAVDRALAGGSAVVVYLTPINHEAGARFAGETFGRAVERNVSVIERVLSERMGSGPALFLDLSRMLGSGMFFENDTATEHLNEAGRQAVAGEVCAAVDRVLRRAGTLPGGAGQT